MTETATAKNITMLLELAQSDPSAKEQLFRTFRKSSKQFLRDFGEGQGADQRP
jgi:hypothetical protein